MTKRTKSSILIICFAAFFVLGYLIILHAYGYKFDFEDWKLEKTGSVLIDTNIDGVQIFINDRLAGKTSLLSGTFAEKNILPGRYGLRIEKDGYPSISKNIEIKSGEVAQLIHIFLADDNEITNFISGQNSKNNKNGEEYYISKKDGLLYRKINNKDEKISSEPVYIKDFVLRILGGKIYLASKDVRAWGIFLLNDEGNWDKIYGKATQDVSLSPDKKKIAVLGFNEINVVWLKDDGDPPYFKKDHDELVLRISQKINQIYWFKTDWHLIYLTENGETHFIDLDPTGGRNDLVI